MRLPFILAATLLATAAAAQTAPEAPAATPAGKGDGRARLLAADANADGKWDKAEWLAAGRREPGFTRIDADKDGFVSPAELKAGMEKLRVRRGGN